MALGTQKTQVCPSVTLHWRADDMGVSCSVLVVMKAPGILWDQDSGSHCLDLCGSVSDIRGQQKEERFDLSWVIPHIKVELVPAGAYYRQEILAQRKKNFPKE